MNIFETFRSAIQGSDGMVDVGYMALAWGMIGWSVSIVTILLIGAHVALDNVAKGPETLTSIGEAIGLVSGGFATMLGAVGMFRYGDKPKYPERPGTTTDTRTRTRTNNPKSSLPSSEDGEPLEVSIVSMPDETDDDVPTHR